MRFGGRIAPLIELSAGFDPELTGRENIYLNASILGFSRKEIESKFDRIIEFSELQEFVDSPSKELFIRNDQQVRFFDRNGS